MGKKYIITTPSHIHPDVLLGQINEAMGVFKAAGPGASLVLPPGYTVTEVEPGDEVEFVLPVTVGAG